MKLKGIRAEYTSTGYLKSVTIDASTKTEFVQNLLDMIAIEAAKNEETIPWKEVKATLNKKHNIV